MLKVPPECADIAEAPQAASLATWAGFAILCLGMFMAILDIQIVATSLPDIQSALDIAPSQMSWVQTSYLIAEVIAIPLTGLLTRALTLRWLFVAAIAVFTVASAGCASSTTFAELVAWRIVQGFAGGMLIPIVFSAVFLMFPERSQALATTIAGVLAVLAPTVGPLVGGYITSTYSWHWLFLINVPAGLVAVILAPRLLPRDAPVPALISRLDGVALVTIAIALAALEIGLKEAPSRGWLSGVVLGLLGSALALGALFVIRTCRHQSPIVDLSNFSDRNFAIGCALSFVLGISLFGSVYLMPVFLVFVRGHDAFEAGQVMLVTGLAQLATAPIAVYLERRIDARVLTAFGFGLLAIGVGLSATQTTTDGFNEMLLPQILRGIAFMFCLLPPTRMALGRLPIDKIPDASALFNLMRNLGGAIGLALIDTMLYGRAPGHAAALAARLEAGDVAAAREAGIPEALYLRGLAGMIQGQGLDPATEAAVRNAVERAAATAAGNEAWAMMAAITAIALLIVPFCRPARLVGPSGRDRTSPVH